MRRRDVGTRLSTVCLEYCHSIHPILVGVVFYRVSGRPIYCHLPRQSLRGSSSSSQWPAVLLRKSFNSLGSIINSRPLTVCSREELAGVFCNLEAYESYRPSCFFSRRSNSDDSSSPRLFNVGTPVVLFVPHEACSLRSTWALAHLDAALDMWASKREKRKELSATLKVVKKKQISVRHARDREAEKVAYG